MRTSGSPGQIRSSGAFLARAVSIGASFALSVAVARELQPATAGTFFVLLAVLTGCASVGRFGTDILGLRLVAAQPDAGQAVAARLFRICLIASTAVALGLVAVVGFAQPSASGGLAGGPFVAAALSVVPGAMAVLAGALLRASRRVALGTFAELGSTPGLAAIGILMWSLVSQLSLAATMYIFVGATIVTSAWAIPTALRLLPPTAEPRSPEIHISRLVPLTGTALSFYLLTWAPVLVLGALSTSTEVAHFTVAARAAGLVSLLPAIQTSYLTPVLAALYHQEDIMRLNRVVQRATRLAVTVGGALTFILTLLPTQSLLVFGGHYEGAAAPLQILAWGALVVAAAGPVNSLMLTCEMEDAASIFSTITLVVITGLLVAASPAHGALGAAIAFTLGTVGYALVSAAALRVRRNVWAPLGRYVGALVPKGTLIR